MQPPYEINSLNNSCFILPRAKIPNGLYLTYDTCPEHFDNSTLKLVKYCCFIIIYSITQQSNYKKAQDFLRDYSSSLLVIPSVLFNILALVVLNRFNRLRNYSQTSTTFYMKSICILDTFTIISKFLHEIVVVRNASRANPIVITSFMCKFLFFFESACSISAIYLLIAMSIDKLICVLLPLKVNQYLTTTRAKIAFTCIILIASLISTFELAVQEAVELPISTINESKNTRPNNSSLSDDLDNKSYSFIRYDCDTRWPERYNDWILFNHIIKVFLPILIICICNLCIVIQLAKSGRRADALFRNESNNTRTNSKKILSSTGMSDITISGDSLPKQNEKVRFDQAESIEGKCSKKTNMAQSSNLSQSTTDLNLRTNFSVINIRRKNTTQHISIMLFAVSFGFVILNLPFAIKTLFKRHFSKDNQMLDNLYHSQNFFDSEYSKAEIKDQVKFEFYSNLTHILLDLNYVVNFFFYFFAGTRFRSQLFELFRLKKSRNQNFSNKSVLKLKPNENTSTYMRIKFSKVKGNKDTDNKLSVTQKNNFD